MNNKKYSAERSKKYQKSALIIAVLGRRGQIDAAPSITAYSIGREHDGHPCLWLMVGDYKSHSGLSPPS